VGLSNKRGLSAIVATISLVLLTFAAVGIIAGFIIPLVRNNLDSGTECVDYKDYFIFREDLGYNCIKIETTRLYAISVGAAGVNEETENKISGFKLAFITSAGDSEAVDVKDPFSNYGGDVGMIRRVNITLPLQIPGSGGARTYVYNSTTVFESVSVAPILKSGRTCGISDSIKFKSVICQKVVTTE